MEIRQDQVKRQLQGVEKIKENNYNGLLKWCVRTGKMFATVYYNEELGHKGILQSFHEDCPFDDYRIAIVVSSPVIRAEWSTEISKYIPHLKSKIDILSPIKLLENPPVIVYDVLIVDEADLYTSKRRQEIIDIESTIIKKNNLILLTATDFLIKKYAPTILNNTPIIDEITIEEANELGFVVPTIEYNLLLNLPEDDFEKYIKYTNSIANMVKLEKLYKFIPMSGIYVDGYLQNPNSNYKQKVNDSISDFGKAHIALRMCINGAYGISKGVKTFFTGNQWVSMLAKANGWKPDLPKNAYNDLIEMWNPVELNKAIAQINTSLIERNDLLKKHKLKEDIVVELITLLNSPTLTFSESSEFADNLYNKLNESEPRAVLYHSKAKVPKENPDGTVKLNKNKDVMYHGTTPLKSDKNGRSSLMLYCMDKLNSKDNAIQTLVSVKGLGRGFTWKQLQNIIITSYTDSTTDYFQSRGRALAINPELNKELQESIIINVIFKNTIEIRKVNKRQSESNIEPIWINDIGELVIKELINE